MHRIGCTDVLDKLAYAATHARQKGRGKRKIPHGPIHFFQRLMAQIFGKLA